MQRRAFLIATASCALAACTGPGGPLTLAPGTTLYVVRHGDRDGSLLSTKGQQRARDLVTALQDAPLDAIYSPGIQRNLDTAAPLSMARNLPVQRRPQEQPTARLIRDSAGKSTIWIGNKGNITTIWEDLNLPAPAPLDYGDLHVLRSDDAGSVTIERRRFGPE